MCQSCFFPPMPRWWYRSGQFRNTIGVGDTLAFRPVASVPAGVLQWEST